MRICGSGWGLYYNFSCVNLIENLPGILTWSSLKFLWSHNSALWRSGSLIFRSTPSLRIRLEKGSEIFKILQLVFYLQVFPKQISCSFIEEFTEHPFLVLVLAMVKCIELFELTCCCGELVAGGYPVRSLSMCFVYGFLMWWPYLKWQILKILLSWNLPGVSLEILSYVFRTLWFLLLGSCPIHQTFSFNLSFIGFLSYPSDQTFSFNLSFMSHFCRVLHHEHLHSGCLDRE